LNYCFGFNLLFYFLGRVRKLKKKKNNNNIKNKKKKKTNKKSVINIGEWNEENKM
jgi:hypothetical protein